MYWVSEKKVYIFEYKLNSVFNVSWTTTVYLV